MRMRMPKPMPMPMQNANSKCSATKLLPCDFTFIYRQTNSLTIHKPSSIERRDEMKRTERSEKKQNKIRKSRNDPLEMYDELDVHANELKQQEKTTRQCNKMSTATTKKLISKQE